MHYNDIQMNAFLHKKNKVVLLVLVLSFALSVFFSVGFSRSVANFEEECGKCCQSGYTVDDIRMLASGKIGLNTDAPDVTESLRVFDEDGFVSVLPANSIDGCSEVYAAEIFQPMNVPDFTRTTLRNSGLSDTQAIVVTFMGCGFTATQQQNFLSNAESMTQFLLGMHPFNLFSHRFNVYAIQTISNQSGVSRDRDTWVAAQNHNVDNFFGSRFWHDGQTERLLYVNTTQPFWGRIWDVLNAHHGTWQNVDVIGILANSTRYGGAGGNVAVTSLHNQANRIMTHEIGHQFGRLADEYWHPLTTPQEAPNRSANNNSATNRWGHWIGREGIGMFPFSEAGISNWFRPHQSCHMRFLASSFCAVCSTEFVRIMSNLSGETFRGRFCPSIVNLTMPLGAARIVDYAFNGNTTLSSITVPDSVATIGRYAFIGATALRTITNNRETPQFIDATTFVGINRSLITLNVPSGTSAAYLAAGWTGFILREQIESALYAPTGVNVNQGIGRVSWNAVSNATGYHLYVDGIRRSVNPITALFFNLNGLSLPAGVYNIQIRAISTIQNVNESPLSDGQNFTVFVTLVAPAGVSVNQEAGTVSWNAVNNAAAYHVYAGGMRVSGNAITVTNFDLNTLSLDLGIHNIQIRAVNPAVYIHDSSLSSVSNFTVSATLATPAVEVDENEGIISWNAVMHATGYYVYINGTPATTSPITSTEINIEQFTLDPGLNYVQARAINPASYIHNSDLSDKVYFMILANLAEPVVAITGSIIMWELVENADIYFIYVDGIRKYEITETSFSLLALGLDFGVHGIQVRASSRKDYFLDSALSETRQFVVTLTLSAPSNLKLNDTDSTLTWDSVLYAAKYQVFVNGVLQAGTVLPSVPLSELNLTEGQNSITVQAIGDTDYILASTHSEPLIKTVNIETECPDCGQNPCECRTSIFDCFDCTGMSLAIYSILGSIVLLFAGGLILAVSLRKKKR